MYTLTLTRAERDAFDWVGGRYSTGFDVANVLVECLDNDDEWSQDSDITFKVSEVQAWEIREFAEQEDGAWPCFSKELAEKMQAFIDEIV